MERDRHPFDLSEHLSTLPSVYRQDLRREGNPFVGRKSWLAKVSMVLQLGMIQGNFSHDACFEGRLRSYTQTLSSEGFRRARQTEDDIEQALSLLQDAKNVIYAKRA